jgi:hypothetical protein
LRPSLNVEVVVVVDDAVVEDTNGASNAELPFSQIVDDNISPVFFNS